MATRKNGGKSQVENWQRVDSEAIQRLQERMKQLVEEDWRLREGHSVKELVIDANQRRATREKEACEQ
jgi:hypothetical protein